MDRVKVGDVLSLQRRAVTVDPDAEYEEIGVRSFGRGIFHKSPVTGLELGSKRVFRIEPDDLVLSNVFAWEGAIAVASTAEAGRIGSHRFMTFVPNDGRIITSWACWFFRSDPGLELIRKASPGSAGRNRTLAIARFLELEVPLPPIEQQHEDAGQLDRVQRAVSRLGGMSDRASSLMNAFVISASTRTDLDSEAKFAHGWRHVTLGEVMTPSITTVQVDPAKQYQIAGIYSFGKGLINRGTLAGGETAYKALTVLSEGDVVVSQLGGWEGAVTVVDAGFQGFCVSLEYPTFKLDRSLLLPEFFRGVTRAPSLWGQIDNNTRGSMARRKRIKPSEFLASDFWLPPMEVQAQVARQLRIADRIAQTHDHCRARIDALVSAALNRAFACVN